MSRQSKIQFIDQAKILVRAGDGGDGHAGFHRAKYVPKGGPDGGDGGKGGDVVMIGSFHQSTLQDFQHRRHFRAEHGEKGRRAQRKGKNGEDIELKVPLGTVIYDAETNELLGEILENEQRLVIAEGGKGGLGNVHFKSSTHQAPREFVPGEIREERWLRLELKLIADIGIVGPPNAGKSTLLGKLTAAHPKVGNYPFTTLSPSLGVLKIKERAITLADVPGLIEGAHEGAGLGIQFLRHIARTRALIYMTPIDAGEPKDVWNQFLMTRNEIEHYSKEVLNRPHLVVLNKIDLKDSKEVQRYVSFFRRKKVKAITVSAEQKLGLEKLIDAIDKLI